MKETYQAGLVSVIMPTYNSGEALHTSIRSIISQTYQNWELLVIDDCSSDETVENLMKLATEDARINPIFLKENRGSGFARNEGISRAKGQYIAFLDSDDLWHHEKLLKQLAFMKRQEYGFTFTAYHVFEKEPEQHKRTVRVPIKINYSQLLKNTIIGCLTVMIDREKVGEFRMPLLRARQDTATWLTILKQQDYAYGMDEPLAYYRVSKTSLSSNKWNMLKKNWQMYREHEGLSFVYTSYVFCCYVCNALWKRRK
ncbi:glycosyltransferase family 2 protein [Listeria newyorkensis]|uniref:Glycosyltransferase family 2 protein n=1 Tax=Listeria newyorkensis TaxID=1497681 RepID=A0A841YWR4_9LIST|nr:glycosyltransferase family 2 protein [Listeria newyorkensis]MBC1457755.1 glycosyltransferase family 2 protein [Listeria newyorkensis]